jgi:hypothetical protein
MQHQKHNSHQPIAGTHAKQVVRHALQCLPRPRQRLIENYNQNFKIPDSFSQWLSGFVEASAGVYVV